jgi:retron-type reverse transcriptase
MNNSQYGFRKGRNTEMALTNMTTHIHNIIEDDAIGVCIFIDVEKAFDCVSHSVLSRTLKKLNFETKALNWFASYLENRLIMTKIGEEISSPIMTNLGCPQGTVMSPDLFNILINSLFLVTILLVICFRG